MLPQAINPRRQPPALMVRSMSRSSGPRWCSPQRCIARLRSLPPRSGTIALVQNCRSSDEKTAGSEYPTPLPRSVAGFLRSISRQSTAPAPLKLQRPRPMRAGSRSQHQPSRLRQARKSGAQPHPHFGYQRLHLYQTMSQSRSRTRGVADGLDAVTSGGSGCLCSAPSQDFKLGPGSRHQTDKCWRRCRGASRPSRLRCPLGVSS
jgi:hypothetical protein